MNASRFPRIVRLTVQAAFLAVFAGLIYSNYSLRAEVARLKSAKTTKGRSVIKAGEVLPEFQVRDVAGKRVALAKDLGRPVRMVVVDPGCPRCETVLADVRGRNAEDVIVVSLRPRAMSQKIEKALGGAAPLYFVDRTAPAVLQSHIDFVPRVLTLETDGRVREVCSDLTECAAKVEPCDGCSATSAM